MQITFTKDHGEFKAGQTTDVESGYGTRLITSGVAQIGIPEPVPSPEPAGEHVRDEPSDDPEVETAVTRPRTKRRKPKDV